MNCSRCGTVLEENVNFCPNCGSPPQQQNFQQPYSPYNTIPAPADYLIWSILSLVFCCLPLGIAALIFSIQCKTAFAAGRYEEAIKHSRTAFQCNLIALIAGILVLIIWFALAMIGVVAENSGNF
ncbi:MAG: CD225/dispanin family protein [Planctomycetaceae bacterium]|jgi:hypothetical protein|nr:CD225/dispanin family protein [Planctomycetaceae bacterium]